MQQVCMHFEHPTIVLIEICICQTVVCDTVSLCLQRDRLLCHLHLDCLSSGLLTINNTDQHLGLETLKEKEKKKKLGSVFMCV